MKQLFKTALMAFVMLFATTSVMAQTKNAENQTAKRERLAKTQAQYIAGQLGLDNATRDKYVTTFMDYHKELWVIGRKPVQRKGKELTDAEVKQNMENRFEHSEKILALRKKYYKKYSQFLTPQQIERAYRLERQSLKRLAERHKAGAQKGKGKKGGR